jgi:hypothetical protein
LEKIKDNPERVQTQMYVCKLQPLSSLCEPFLPLLLRNYPNLKGRNSVAWTISETSDLIPAGQQIGKGIAFAKIEDEEIHK